MSSWYLLGEIGDSWLTNTCASTSGSVSTANPTGAAGVLLKGSLEAILLGPKVGLLDKGVGGTTTQSWQPGGSNLINAKAAWEAVAIPSRWVIAIQLGINDSSESVAYSGATYQTKMDAIVTDLLSWGAARIVLFEPPYIPPITANHTADGVNRLIDYQTSLANIVSAHPGGRVVVASGIYNYMASNYASVLGDDHVHPTPTGGAQSVADQWAGSFYSQLGPLLEPDKGLPVGTYTETWDAQTTAAQVSSIAGWSNLIGSAANTIVTTTSPRAGGKCARFGSSAQSGDAVTYSLLGKSRNQNLLIAIRASSNAKVHPIFAVDASNYYKFVVPYSGSTAISIVKVVAGSPTTLVSGNTAQAQTAGTYYAAEFDIRGPVISARLYSWGGSVPAFELTYNDTSPLAISYPGCMSEAASSTNAQWDDFIVTTRQSLGRDRHVPRSLEKGLQRGVAGRY